MLQLAQSSDIRDKVIKDFNLFRHYDIDTLKNIHFRTDVIKMYEENVTIKKTEYESMEITVLDEDPVIASAMVDSIIHFFDVKARSLQAEKCVVVMIIAKSVLTCSCSVSSGTRYHLGCNCFMGPSTIFAT